MGNVIGFTILGLAIAGVIWFILTRKKSKVEPGTGGGGGVTPGPTDPVITDDEGNEFTEDDLTKPKIDPDKLDTES